MKKVLPLASLLVAASLFTSFVQAQTVVCVETNLDTFCMELKESDAPLATANFLTYVNNGTYNNTVIHQSVRHGYFLGGSWQASVIPNPVVAGVPIGNEFKLPNKAGSVALVTTPGNPDSATTGWRINVADNSALFSKNNSGAVFAQIIDDTSMAVVKRLSGLTVHRINNDHLQQAPLLQLDNLITDDDLVIVKRMYVYDGGKDAYLLNGLPNVVKPVMGEVVCLVPNILGELCLKLDRDDAPKTVANFLNYVNSGRYDGTIIHRSVANFVLQGGGFKYVNGNFAAITTDAPVANEYKRSNVRGTVAMAKSDGAPDSATSQWFINEVDNVPLDTTNGGFTVFAEVIPHSLQILDALAGIPAFNLDPTVTGSSFNNTPLLDGTVAVSADNLITIEKAYVTQRDISASVSPLINVVAMATYGPLYGMIAARFPVYVGNKFYMMSLKNHAFTDAEIKSGLDKQPGLVLMDVDTTHILELIPNFRIAATFDGQLLTIPTVRVADQVFVNVQLKLIDSKNLVFQLLPGYEQL
jgi:cyclophilin family peptidyl-prolyl cis-trans isomerase